MEVSIILIHIPSCNEIGISFWEKQGWIKRDDLFYYDFALNESAKRSNNTSQIHPLEAIVRSNFFCLFLSAQAAVELNLLIVYKKTY